MKKKGFTLIELLAVIIVVAIIALIAVPLVLNSIEKARIGAAKVSAATYINEVEKYIILAKMDPSKVQLEAGQTYLVSSEENASGVILNDLIKIKGDKPEGGTVEIGYDNKVESALLIINNYKFECENGNCDYKGKAVEENIIPEDPVVTVYAEPTLTINGITKVNIDVDKYPGTKTYYSIDNGENWIEYTGVVYEKFETIQVKSISVSGNESNIITESYIESSSDYIPVELFDSNESNRIFVTYRSYKSVNIDSSAENIQIKMLAPDANYIWYYFYNSNGEQIGDVLTPNGDYVTVPEGSVRLKLFNSLTTNEPWNELVIKNQPLITIDKAYPILTLDGIKNGQCISSINYYKDDETKLYNINDGEWIKYNGSIKINQYDKLTVKGISKFGIEHISNTTCEAASDSISDILFDSNESNNIYVTYRSYKSVNIDSSAENIQIKMLAPDAKYIWYYFYNSNGEQIGDVLKPNGDYVTVPEGSVRLKLFNSLTTNEPWNELVIKNQPLITIDKAYPILTSTGVIDGVCNVDVKYYKEEKSKLYQIENGEWNNYNGSLKINPGSTFSAKGISKLGAEHISTAKCEEASDGLSKTLYNGNESSSYTVSRQLIMSVNIDSSAENIEIKMLSPDAKYIWYYFYNSNGEQIGDVLKPGGNYVTVPSGAVKLKILNSLTSATNWNQLVIKQS